MYRLKYTFYVALGKEKCDFLASRRFSGVFQKLTSKYSPFFAHLSSLHLLHDSVASTEPVSLPSDETQCIGKCMQQFPNA